MGIDPFDGHSLTAASQHFQRLEKGFTVFVEPYPAVDHHPGRYRQDAGEFSRDDADLGLLVDEKGFRQLVEGHIHDSLFGDRVAFGLDPHDFAIQGRALFRPQDDGGFLSCFYITADPFVDVGFHPYFIGFDDRNDGLLGRDGLTGARLFAHDISVDGREDRESADPLFDRLQVFQGSSLFRAGRGDSGFGGLDGGLEGV